MDRAESILASQRLFYDERAPDFADPSKPSDRRVRGLLKADLVRTVLEDFRPTGRVLEFACGPGSFTAELASHADHVTAVDASPRMLAIAQERVGRPNVSFVASDIFEWRSDATYDAVFFGHWISHVPPSRFDDFWKIVRNVLGPGGRVGFLDEDDRAASYDDVRQIDGVPVARRRLTDGREFDIVKIFWRPEDLETRLRASGWDVTVRRVGDDSLYGTGAPSLGRVPDGP